VKPLFLAAIRALGLSPAGRGGPGTFRGLGAVVLCTAVMCACSLRLKEEGAAPSHPAEASAGGDTVDAILQRAASDALGGREGAVIVMDPQTGRLRAVVNPRLAFEQAFPPGSAIKPFTALAALRAGLIDRESRVLCRERYTRGDFEIACSHPKSQAPFDLARALAYSCNYYFAHLGERLSEGPFDAALDSFGFGARTGVNARGEAAGSLPRGEWRVSDALGESHHLLVTPVQLLTAYAALVNGGHLYRPRQAAPQGFIAQEVTRLRVAPSHRAALIEGMRGAVKYGTAASAELYRLPFDLFGKTGTSTSSNGFRSQGWFIGFVADGGPQEGAPPDRVRLAVIVFLKRGHGAQSAEVARPVFEAYARECGMRSTQCVELDCGMSEPNKDSESQISDSEWQMSAKANPPSAIRHPQSIKVHLVREGVTKAISLEEYVRGVLAAEASVEGELEALKAQAVTSRTFAMKNRGRHAGDGYDFCSTTHCQRFGLAQGAGGDGRVSGKVAGRRSSLLRAVAETEGEVLRDERGQLADTYFHAACGGMTANIEAVWGVAAPAYLRGVRDDYCATMPHRSWMQVIPAARLAAALRSDPRSDVGSRLDKVMVTKRDASGRAEFISLEGERRRSVRGWDFKLIVGRALGWQLLKSSRFEVARHGTNFVFRGSGFGHGLGLCQEGAHVMARRGASYRQVLGHYFPGTQVEAERGIVRSSWSRNSAEVLPLPSTRRLSLSSEHFRASYPAQIERGEVEAVLRGLEAVREDLARRLAAASLRPAEPSVVEVIIHNRTPDFVAATGQPWWVAAVTRGRRIELQPLSTLRRRSVLTTTLRHEYTHLVIEALGGGRTPRWLAEGLAVHVAGEGAMLARFEPAAQLTRDELEQRLARPGSPQEMRALYAAAYREVRALLRSEGEAGLWRRVAQR